MHHIRSFLELKKNLKHSVEGFKRIRVAVLSDTATQFFCTALKGEGIDHRIDFEIYEADYNQIDQEVFNPQSRIHSENFDFIILLKSSEKLLDDFQKMPIDQRQHFAQEKEQWFTKIIQTIGLKTKLIFNNFPFLTDGVFSNFGSQQTTSFPSQLRTLNFNLQKVVATYSNTFMCDLDQLQNLVGINGRIDQKFYLSSKLAYSLDFLPLMVSNYTSIILAATGVRLRKCLILDLDNTTWGGVIGDDGMEGIQIGNLGNGKAFDRLQCWAKELKNRGIILCICSKNTEEIAREPFEKHPGMTLRMEDIAVFVANWENKADNIRYIQSVLNIGFDSMVFIDDNAFERNLVRQELPEVFVPDLPEDAAEYFSFLSNLNVFETAAVSTADGKRTKMYQVEAERKKHSFKFTSYDDYLRSLEMKAEVDEFSEFSIPRLSQLSQRSNQFNLRTIRYTESELTLRKNDPNWMTMSIKLADRFGSHGIISMVMGEIRGDELFIDTWIMSCRVLKRKVSFFVLDRIVAFCKAKEILRIRGEYIPTPKNKIVVDHFKNLGFTPDADQWILDVSNHSWAETSIQLQEKVTS